jgi:hypothetical protein
MRKCSEVSANGVSRRTLRKPRILTVLTTRTISHLTPGPDAFPYLGGSELSTLLNGPEVLESRFGIDQEGETLCFANVCSVILQGNSLTIGVNSPVLRWISRKR